MPPDAFTAKTRNPARDGKLNRVDLADKPIQSLDNGVHRAFSNNDDAVPNAFKHLFDTIPCRIPVTSEHALDKLDNAAKDVIFKVSRKLGQIASQSKHSGNYRSNSRNHKWDDTTGQKEESQPRCHNASNQ